MPTRLDQGPFRYFYRAINPITRILVRLGVRGPSDDLLRLLRVRGRKSGRPYEVPVRINTLNAERFIVAMFATAQWVQNLRAAREAEIVLGKAAEPVKVQELQGEDKLAFVTAYMSRPKLAKRVKAVLGADPQKLSTDEFQRAIAELPVFRLEPVQTSTP
jgi:deazaflavin-dependent oxidoreductase (nitroreductase family)